MRPLTDLEPVEGRVLGALMEKQQTTPDNYPLSVNSLVSACNQKTNRDPVMKLTEMEVLNTLRVLQHDGWVERITGARVPRWGHSAETHLGARPSRIALITLLLLRGAQTPGELRSRSERLHPFETVEDVLVILRELAEREPPLVEQLPRQPGQKESRWVLFGQAPAAEPGQFLRSFAPAAAEAEDIQSQLDDLLRRVQRLEEELDISPD